MKLDYLLGRAVQEVKEFEYGWAIVLEGGVQIVDENPDDPMPSSTDFDTLSFTKVEESDLITLSFGTSASPEQVYVTLVPGEYSIVTETGHRHDPEAEAAPTPLPEDPSPERVVDGPSEEWLASQESQDDEDEETP